MYEVECTKEDDPTLDIPKAFVNAVQFIKLRFSLISSMIGSILVYVVVPTEILTQLGLEEPLLVFNAFSVCTFSLRSYVMDFIFIMLISNEFYSNAVC